MRKGSNPWEKLHKLILNYCTGNKSHHQRASEHLHKGHLTHPNGTLPTPSTMGLHASGHLLTVHLILSMCALALWDNCSDSSKKDLLLFKCLQWDQWALQHHIPPGCMRELCKKKGYTRTFAALCSQTEIAARVLPQVYLWPGPLSSDSPH